ARGTIRTDRRDPGGHLWRRATRARRRGVRDRDRSRRCRRGRPALGHGRRRPDRAAAGPAVARGRVPRADRVRRDGPGGTVMIRSLRAELTKIGHWPAYWALLALWAILAIVFGYVTPYLAYANPVAGTSALAQQTALAGLLPAQIVGEIRGYPLFGGVIALAIGALAMGSEFGWGTWTTILLQEPGRARVVAGKLLALLIAE